MSLKLLKDMAERAGKTFAGTFLTLYAPVVLGAGSLGGLLDLSFANKAAAAGVASVFSLVMSLVSTRKGDAESASLVK